MTKVSPLLLMAFAFAAPVRGQGVAKPACPPTMDHAAMEKSGMDHAAHAAMETACAGPLPTMPGQAAFGAISEVVKILSADPATDWSKVNIEALRQHLVDMDEVLMRSTVKQRNVPGGVEMTVTGGARTAAAIKRMAVSHAQALDGEGMYSATSRVLENGAVLTVVAKDAADASAVARIRGLGFAGLMTEGDHHARHHLAIARGDMSHH